MIKRCTLLTIRANSVANSVRDTRPFVALTCWVHFLGSTEGLHYCDDGQWRLTDVLISSASAFAVSRAVRSSCFAITMQTMLGIVTPQPKHPMVDITRFSTRTVPHCALESYLKHREELYSVADQLLRSTTGMCAANTVIRQTSTLNRCEQPRFGIAHRRTHPASNPGTPSILHQPSPWLQIRRVFIKPNNAHIQARARSGPTSRALCCFCH